MEVSIDLLIKDVIGPVTTGFASLIIFAEMPSKPVAFFILKSNNSITLSENNDIVNDPKKVSEIFNDFFINVAKNIGNPNTFIDENHPSIQAIRVVCFYSFAR
jgi:hypothetical protein